MNCPYCNHKAIVIETRQDTEHKITYRERRCTECQAVFYAQEQISVVDVEFLRKWDDASRWKTRKNDQKNTQGASGAVKN